MFERLPGFRDFYPEDCARRNHLFRIWRQTARRYGFSEWDGPLLEPLELYTEKSGPEIVSQLFNFTDKGEREVSLRPELTPTLARLVGAKANALRKPVKWFAIGENFRYEKPQKGRLRSHYQFNGDIFGEAGPGADAELIALVLGTLRALGLRRDDIVLRLSDRQLWMEILAAAGKEGDDAIAVLGVIDKMEREPREVTIEKLQKSFGSEAENFLQRIEHLTSLRDLDSLEAALLEQVATEAKERLTARLADWRTLYTAIEAFGLADYVRIDLGIVRGLAYYTGFVFEVFELSGEGTTGRAVAGGGRYDHLVEKLGYNAIPACGFGMGDVVLGDLLDEKGLMPNYIEKPDFFAIIGGDTERPSALEDIGMLRDAGYVVEYPLKGVGFGKQFKNAGQSGATFALIYGTEEVAKGEVKVRDMQSGNEKSFNRFQLPSVASVILEAGL